jgi:hypothetical protein
MKSHLFFHPAFDRSQVDRHQHSIFEFRVRWVHEVPLCPVLHRHAQGKLVHGHDSKRRLASTSLHLHRIIKQQWKRRETLQTAVQGDDWMKNHSSSARERRIFGGIHHIIVMLVCCCQSAAVHLCHHHAC